MAASDPDPWVSASEIGDYAYCPRSHWYARTRGDAVAEDPRAARGRSFHARSLGAVERRSAHRARYAAMLLIGLLVAAIALGLLYRSA